MIIISTRPSIFPIDFMGIQQNIDNEFLTVNKINLFRHKAMNTIFELYIADEEKEYSSQAAYEVFREIDLIENDLSKFIPNSDISKINSSPVNTAVVVGEHAFESLQDCSKLYDITNGSFNITLGRLIDRWKEGDRKENSVEIEEGYLNPFSLILDDTDFSVTKMDDVLIDMGGYGKGYALDKSSKLLAEWSVNSFLINGGYSTVLACDSRHLIEGWPVSISVPNSNDTPNILSIQNIALSGSGLEKGHHIVDPENRNATARRKASWAACRSAAWSDAFSTAFMILDTEAVSKICSEYKIDAMLLGQNEDGISIDTFGDIFRNI